jgi:Tfp pilus assembly PilM family ATPase
MITINKSGPDGNVFCILGHAKSVQKQLKKFGAGENEVIAAVLQNFTQMKYDDICEKLESTGLFEFVDWSTSEYDDEPLDDDDCY